MKVGLGKKMAAGLIKPGADKGEKFSKTMIHGFPVVARHTTQTSGEIIDEVSGGRSRLN
jgi:hypothetical protein